MYGDSGRIREWESEGGRGWVGVKRGEKKVDTYMKQGTREEDDKGRVVKREKIK